MRAAAVFAVIVSLALCLMSCSSSDPSSADTTPPTVTDWSIADGATDVGLITPVEVTFSEDMDASTITDTTVFAVGRAPRGYVEYDEATRTATYLPDTLYAQNVWHALVIDGPTSESGVPVERDSVSFQTGALDCAHLVDQLEPNDDLLTPAEVQLDHEYHTLTICGEDEDFVTFTLDETKKVTVTCHFDHADDEDWFIQFLRSDGESYTWQGSGAFPDFTREFSFSFMPGTYVVQLDSYDDPTYILYDLELATSEPCVDDQYEDNDFIDEAAPLTTNETHQLTGCRLDVDVFSFHAEAGQTITLTATQTGGLSAHSRLKLYGPEEGLLTSEDFNENVSTVSAVAADSGTHYAHTRYWADVVAYELRIDVED